MSEADVELEPVVAEQIFGDRIDLARAFTRELGERGEELGLIGPLEASRIWTRHVLNSAVVAELLRPGTVGDVGSGAGLPGIVLAIARPDVKFVLIEPMERRVHWLNSQVQELGLDNVVVERARAEDVALRHPLDQVTARAVSALKTLIPLTAPLLSPGGELVLLKGANAQAEIGAAAKQISKYKLSNVEVVTVGDELLEEPTRVVRARYKADVSRETSAAR